MLKITKKDIFPPATPLPDLKAVATFPTGALPPEIERFIVDAADRISCPLDFLAVASVTALSALIGRKRMIRGKMFDDWTIVPNLWGMLIGPPSAMKSPALRVALAPLDDLEIQLANSYNEAVRAHGLELRLRKMQSADLERSAKSALKAGDINAAKELLSAEFIEEQAPSRPRLIVNDATVEKLQELLSTNPNGLLLVRDELGGLIATLESEEFAEHRSFLLVAHGGRSRFVVDRIGRGTIVLPSVCVSWLGGVQPARVARLVKGAVGGLSDDGLLQRFQMTVWPDFRTPWQWKDRQPCPDAQRAYESLFASLYEMEHKDEPLSMSLAAYQQFRDWYVAMRASVDSGDLAPALASHILKAPEAVLSLALIFQLCSDVRSESVEGHAMEMAIEWAGYLRSHAERLYHSQSAPEIVAAKRLIKSKDRLPSAFTARDIYRRNWEGLGREGASAALALLVDYGHLYEMVESTGGRPTKSYQWTY